MPSIPLRCSDKCTLVDEDDVPLLKGYRLYYDRQERYAIGCLGQTPPKALHRILIGRLPSDAHVIDHVDGDRLNNQRSNLRVVTEHENQINRHVKNRNNTSGVRGVTYEWKRPRIKRWTVQIGVHWKHKHIGYYLTVEEAIEARLAAERKYWGVNAPVINEEFKPWLR